LTLLFAEKLLAPIYSFEISLSKHYLQYTTNKTSLNNGFKIHHSGWFFNS